MDKTPAQIYAETAKQFDVPTKQREIELSDIIINGCEDDRDMAMMELVHGHMRLVLNLTRRYKNMPDFVDTLFDGNFGLVKAALTYDHRKGKFSTWATPKILTEIRDGLLSRLNSPLSVTRYASEFAFKIKHLNPDKNGNVNIPDIAIAKLAMLGIMDGIPLYDENGNPVDIVDVATRSAADNVQNNDLIELVKKATTELHLTDDEIMLVSEAGCKSNDGSIVPLLAQKNGVSGSAIRMRRTKLLWQIRRKILSYVGKEEYLMLSAIGHIPENNWR